jgi:hypothetical protein
MADFGLAAQIGRGGGGGNAMAQPADPMNRMTQLMQLQNLQQNMMLVNELAARQRELHPLALRKGQEDIDTEVARRGLIGEQTGTAREQRLSAERTGRAESGALDFIASTPPELRTDPARLDALRRSNPGAFNFMTDTIARARALQEKARAEGFSADRAQFEFQQAALGGMSSLLPAVSERTWPAIYDDYRKIDPVGARVIGPDFTPENVAALRARIQDRADLKFETDAQGFEYIVNTRDGSKTPVVKRGVNPPATSQFGALDMGARINTPQMIGQGAAGLVSPAAMEPSGAAPIIQPRAAAPGGVTELGPRAMAAGETTRATEAARIQVKSEEEARKVSRQLDEAIQEISAVAKPGGLISQSTGSGIGQAVDAAAAFIGVSTSGARAGARLAPIADLALKLVPRFEGPQSDSDRKAYERASGQIADTSIPVATRQDAARELVRLMQKRRDQFGVRDTSTAAQGAQLGAQDQQALSWANSNPNDPRAALIKQRLGVQ